MSYARFVKENRGMYIDHRADARPLLGPGVAVELDEEPANLAAPPPSRARRLRARSRARGRFRPVRPVFAPSVFSDPLPYVEPWERWKW